VIEGFHDDSSKRKITSSTSTLSSKPKKVKVEDTIATAVSEMAYSIEEMTSTMVSTASKSHCDSR
jgi:predicted metal-dependent RNase